MSRERALRQLLERRAGGDLEGPDADSFWLRDELSDAWWAAQAEARAAYDYWHELPGADGYAVYRAAQDRADEAQNALWQQHLLDTAARARREYLA
jgi:hypothetical protein